MTEHEFESVYRAYFGQVYHYVLGLARDAHIAEEIASETFFKALYAIDRFRGDCDLGSWLCQIAKNCYSTYLRKSGRLEPLEGRPEAPDPAANMEEDLLQRADSMRIHTILHAMEEPYKEVFSLRVLGELSFRQIGALFGKTENWACVTYHRARKKIQKEMEDIT